MSVVAGLGAVAAHGGLWLMCSGDMVAGCSTVCDCVPTTYCPLVLPLVDPLPAGASSTCTMVTAPCASR